MSLIEYPTETSTEQNLNEFEELYIEVRGKEGRVLTDYEVELLPDVDPMYAHYTEWQIRKRSAQRLIAYLKQKERPLKILEIGCGNGWLSSKLAAIGNSQVTGLDINRVEIAQAKRIFKTPNLEFLYSYFDAEIFGQTKYDVIVFAASIQYFPSLNGILGNALSCLSDKGEIHIIDSPFYKPAEVLAAAKRTRYYFKGLGYPQMAANYFHHSLSDMQQFNYEVLLNPTGIFNRRIKRSPFYWFCITHS